ncbi:FAD-binding oxidoreductase [Sandaracinobacteroides saxicola]|uniref:D-lactate dehydrogenase (cytochrome) n=1 Tax=Sandaracinobacteroides saxicola TaxID=2759707 RepID=A0A7G5IG19_9SPHN|nr:FAD-binding oxidoreductase [Sandaracinobacteroides saxicola]QMW22311.1 FAD-binding oxidoreductase [Sandaracinobacteroides saxicola]
MATAFADTAADTPIDIVTTLTALLGADAVLTAEDDRRFYGTDVYRAGKIPSAVVLPGNVEQLQAIVRACAETRTPLTVRGGGASYTDGYTHAAPRGITLSTERLNNIVEIDETDATVTVEAGCTWKDLHEALAAKGWRTPFWGPFSGMAATVGGSISQNAISHGTGAYGVSAESLLCVEIVTGTGELLATGSAGNAVADPFFRHFGPDLAGLFTGDCGALGVKARITLKMIRARTAFETASFSFDSFEALHAAMRAIAIENLDDENFGLDAALQQGQIGRQEGVDAKVEIAKSVMKSSGGVVAGMKNLAKMAIAGDRELKAANYVAHYIAEGVDSAEAKARIARLKALAGAHGDEIANTVPTVVRGMPFAPLTNTLGPKGERWVPMHGLFSHSAVTGFHHALMAYWQANRAVMDAHGIFTGAMFMAVGSSGFVYEPTFYWPDAQHAYHARVVPADHLAALPRYAAAPDAAAEVKRMKTDVAELMHAHGAAHLQVGKFYPYLKGRNPASVALLRAVKAALDPHNILNPGALGL